MDCYASNNNGLGNENRLDYNYADESRTEHATKRTFHAVWKSKQPPRIQQRDSFGVCNVSQGPAKAVSFREDTSLSSSYNDSCCISYYDQCFDTIKKIGEGSFGEVFKVKSKDDGKFYAVKKTKVMFAHKWDRISKIEEVRRHETIPKHDNCVEMVFSWEEYEYLYIQLELCETSLEDMTRVHVLPEESVWLVTLDLLMAVQHIHHLNIIHLDIKLENILISPLGRCKLGDFGIAVDITQNNLSDSLDGDSKYLAPEVLENKFSKAADVFSLGVVTLEVATDLVIPRRGPLWHQLRSDVFPVTFLAGLSSEMTSLITRMMTSDAERRPNVDQILAAPHLIKLRASVTPTSANPTIVKLLALDDSLNSSSYLTPPHDPPGERCTPPCPHSRSPSTLVPPHPRHSLPLAPLSLLATKLFSDDDEDDHVDDRRNSSMRDDRNSSMRDDRNSSLRDDRNSSMRDDRNTPVREDRSRRLLGPGGRDPDYYNFVSRQSPRLSPIHFQEDEAMDTTDTADITADITADSTAPNIQVINSTPHRGKPNKADDIGNARRLFN